MKILTRFALIPILAAGFVNPVLAEHHETDAATDYAALQAEGSEDGNAWYMLSAKARNAGDTDLAWQAVAMAEELEFSAVRVGFEKMKIAIVSENFERAEDELQKIADSGFASPQLFVSDDTISKLKGRERYDEIVAAMEVAAYPCLHDDGFKDFDFWLGDWEVHVQSGQLAGYNTITRAERGCVIMENWTNAGGGTGMSINYLDKNSNEWVQVWNAEGGSQINVRGGLTEEGMAMEGLIHYVNNGETYPFRALWTPLEDGRVRQYFEQSTDDGETWQPWFEGFYSRKEKAE